MTNITMSLDEIMKNISALATQRWYIEVGTDFLSASDKQKIADIDRKLAALHAMRRELENN